MTNIIRAMKRCTNRDDVFHTLSDFYRAKGFNSLTFGVPDGFEPALLQLTCFGVPSDWLTAYQEQALHRVDQVVPYAMSVGEIFRYSEIADKIDITREALDYAAFSRGCGITDGYILPTYGFRERVAAFGIGQIDSEAVFAQNDIVMLHAAAQQAHLRLDQIELDNTPEITLSPREAEILQWIAHGKSNNDVATILQISSATVATYVKRVFRKLHVCDRTAASLHAVEMGLIRGRARKSLPPAANQANVSASA